MNKIVELYKEAEKTAFIDDFVAGELAELHNPNELEELASRLQVLLKRAEEADIPPYDKRVLLEICRRRLNKLKKALDLAKRPPHLELDASLTRGEVIEGELIEVKYVIENLSGRRASVRLECSASEGLELLSFPAKEIELRAGERYEGFFELRASQSGRFKIGSLRAVAKFEDGTELSKTMGPYEVYVRSPRVKLEASVSGPKRVKEGEPLGIQLRLVNAGETPLEVIVEGFNGWKGWRGQLEPGKEEVVNANLSLPAGVHVIKPVIRYRDPRGREEIIQSEEVRVEVAGPVVKETEEKAVKKAEEEVHVDVEGLMGTITKGVLAAAAGAYLGKMFPEIKRYDKPVLIQDLVWSKVKTAEGEEVTAILEHPVVTVIEDKGKYILIRRAKVTELLASTDRKLAKRLQTEFISRAEDTLKSWNPPALREGIHVSIKKLDIGREELRKLEKELRRAGLRLDERIVDELPRNLLLEASYKTGKIIKRTKYRVYVLAYSRLGQLYFNEVDHKPMSLAEAQDAVEGRIKKGARGVLIYASPTGWDPQSTQEVKIRSSPSLQLVLINLKTGEVHTGLSNPVVDELAALLARGGLEISPPSREDEKELEKLNELLLSGKLSEKEYRRQLEILLKRSRDRKVESLEPS